LRKAIKIIFARGNLDPGLTQALSQFDRVREAEHDLDVFEPNEINQWFVGGLSFPQVEAPMVSIVIPVFNNYETTLSCLWSIYHNTDSLKTSYEVIVADDLSTDKTRALENIVTGINVVRGSENVGFLKNCNQAVPHARGEYIVLLNNDTNVQKGWLEPLISPLQSDQKIGITGPMFLYPDGRLQEAGGIIFSDANGWNYGRLDLPNKPEYNFSREVDYISGACLAFTKEFWLSCNGFDEHFTPAYYEDTDLCFTARQKGLKVMYIPLSKVVHYEGVSHGVSEELGVKKYQAINRERFKEKWQDILTRDHFTSPEDLFAARRHGKAKKTLLFIDHYVPFYDKDAGSKVAQRYIELMLENDINVIFMGDNFYPHQPYTKELQSKGVEVLFGEFYKKNWFEWFKSNARYIDTVYLNRPHISKQYIDKIRSVDNCPYLVYHGADLHYVRVARQEDLGVADKEQLSSNEWKAIEYDIMRKCDLSLWLSDTEVAEVRSVDSSIKVAYKPMYWFDSSDFEEPRSVVSAPTLLFVGGFGHPPNLDALTWFLDDIFPAVLQKNPDAILTVIGSNCPDSILSRESANLIIKGYVSEDELEEAYANSRLSVVPLRYGAGVKGKVIESMKLGVPVITTTIGAEGLPGQTNAYLSVADSAEEFAARTIELLSHDELCLQLMTSADGALTDCFSKARAHEALQSMFR